MKTPLLVALQPCSTAQLEQVADYLENMATQNALPVPFALSVLLSPGQELPSKEYSKVTLFGLVRVSNSQSLLEEETVSSVLNLLRTNANEIKNGAMIPFLDILDILRMPVEWFRVRYEPYEADPTVAFIGQQMDSMEEGRGASEMFFRLRKYVRFTDEDFAQACFFEEKPLMQEKVLGMSFNLKLFDLLGGFPEVATDIQPRALLMGYKFLPIKPLS